jgi:hypothetical protein
MTEMEYDDNGNIIGERGSFASPLGKYMGANVDLADADYAEDEGVIVKSKRPLRDPEARAALPMFRTLTLSELENLPDPEWLVTDILPADALTTVYGAPGSTKSFLALDIACSIASGHTFHNKEVRQGKVIYCVGEGLRGMKWRVEAWKLAHPSADHQALDENLIIVPHAVRLLEKTEQEMLFNTAKELAEESELRMFIVDTWARSLTGGDENSAQDAGIAIDVCEKIRAETGASPLVVHHSGADGMRERGSTALRGASDCTLHMDKQEASGLITLTCKKSKDSEPFAPMRFMLRQYGHSVVLEEQVNIVPQTNGSYYGTQKKSRADWAREAAERSASPF